MDKMPLTLMDEPYTKEKLIGSAKFFAKESVLGFDNTEINLFAKAVIYHLEKEYKPSEDERAG